MVGRCGKQFIIDIQSDLEIGPTGKYDFFISVSSPILFGFARKEGKIETSGGDRHYSRAIGFATDPEFSRVSPEHILKELSV